MIRRRFLTMDVIGPIGRHSVSDVLRLSVCESGVSTNGRGKHHKPCTPQLSSGTFTCGTCGQRYSCGHRVTYRFLRAFIRPHVVFLAFKHREAAYLLSKRKAEERVQRGRPALLVCPVSISSIC